MGNDNSSKPRTWITVEERREIAKNSAITQYLKKQQEIEQKQRKVLLLGCDEAGKSTLVQQGRFMSGEEKQQLSPDEVIRFKRLIARTVIDSMIQLVAHTPHSTDVAESIAYFEGSSEESSHFPEFVDEEMAKHVRSLWGSGYVRQSFHERCSRGLEIQDNCRHFLDAIDRISERDYVPTKQDLLFLRMQTSHVLEFSLKFNEQEIVLIDTAGQNTERSKWLHMFTRCKGILFVAAISEFDQAVPGDPDSSRLQESLDLFDQICRLPYFKRTHIMLFLNKRDLLQEKLADGVNPREVCPQLFKDLQSAKPTYDEVVEHIVQLFAEKNDCRERIIYCHVTCATDPSNVKQLFDIIYDILLQEALEGVMDDKKKQKVPIM
eukprot:TRINITY_DN23499_c0_g1_i1.p1 TRINITY_DN23499_c0_g1~~TRINITY_DN23499_c0_g1_i1.p1  ORF type:complete len:378 (-),score=83.58 TRINITY_DN23499_c0_g1_i1:80-1213(-)